MGSLWHFSKSGNHLLLCSKAQFSVPTLGAWVVCCAGYLGFSLGWFLDSALVVGFSRLVSLVDFA